MVIRLLSLLASSAALKVTPPLEATRPHANAFKHADKPFCAKDSAYHEYDWGFAPHPGQGLGCRPIRRSYRKEHQTPSLPATLLGVCGKKADEEPPVKLREESVTCSCCSLGFDLDCIGGGCTCPEDSHPMTAILAEAARGPRRQLFTAQEGLQMLKNRNIMFVGDASTRRLMWALCAFLNGWSFKDRFHQQEGHPDYRCPLWDWPARRHPEEGPMADFNVALEFFWAPSAEDFWEKVRPRAPERWDLVVTNVYHWDRLHSGKSTEQLIDDAVEHIRWRSRHMIVPVLLMTPSLVAQQPEVNKDILRYTKLLKQANFTQQPQGSSSMVRVLVSDSSSWMSASEGSLERHPCLGDTQALDDPTGISVNGHFSQSLRVQQLLTHMGGILNFGPLDSFGKTGRWKKLPFLKDPQDN